MGKQLKKGFEPWLFRFISAFIGICYLINPIQEQVHYAIHEMSHLIEMPNTLISQEYLNSKGEIHQTHEHSLSKASHEHEIIDFIKNTFETEGENEQSDFPKSEIKYDKHLATNLYNVKISKKTNSKKLFWDSNTKSHHGYTLKPIEPPQVFLH